MTKNYLSLIALVISNLTFAQNRINLGGDISMLPEYERVNTPYYNSAGNKIVPLTYFKNNAKMNSMRVRLFVNPSEPSNNKSGIVQDLEYVKKLGKRIKDAGFDFLLDFQYSDTWADPMSQSVPKTWYTGTLSATNPSNETLTDSVYSYTKRCLEYLSANGARPDFVQIGNEISYGMLWRTDNDKVYTSQNATSSGWKRFAGLLSSASKAVREVTPDAKIIIHIERSGQASTAKAFFDRMAYYKVDYDMIGLSYYPFHHGSLSALSTTLKTLGTSFPDKPVQIVETAYYYQNYPSDTEYNTTATWAATTAGQQAFIKDLCAELAKHNNVTGLYYWFPEENGNGGASWSASNVVLSNWLNRGLWNNSSHKAMPAVLSLQDFLKQKEAVGIERTEMQTSTGGIYTITGQKLQEEPDRGVYIKNGRKIVK